jgi:hypothetical protein
MTSVEQQFSELRTAVIASGKITAKQIIEATKAIETEEQRLSILQEMASPHNVTVPRTESFSEKVAHLTEKIVASGKVTALQINESMKECSNEKERFESLQSLAIAKKIGVKPVERKNGTPCVVQESQASVFTKDQKIARTAKEMRMTLQEAALFLDPNDRNYAPSNSGATFDEAMKKWMSFPYNFSREDAKRAIEKGMSF